MRRLWLAPLNLYHANSYVSGARNWPDSIEFTGKRRTNQGCSTDLVPHEWAQTRDWARDIKGHWVSLRPNQGPLAVASGRRVSNTRQLDAPGCTILRTQCPGPVLRQHHEEAPQADTVWADERASPRLD